MLCNKLPRVTNYIRQNEDSLCLPTYIKANATLYMTPLLSALQKNNTTQSDLINLFTPTITHL